MNEEALLARVAELVEEVGKLRNSIAALVRENVQFRDALTTVSDQLLALVEPMRQTARATVDVASRENTVLWKQAQELEALARAVAVLVDNVKDAERAAGDAKIAAGGAREAAIEARENTNRFPLQTPDETEKWFGKAGAWALRHWKKFAVGFGPGLGWLGHHLFSHWRK